MRRACYAGLVALVVLGSATAAQASQYGAIAYSQSTGAIGYAYNCGCRSEAENMALTYCEADDARVVGWSQDAYCALALGDDLGAYGVAWGGSRAEAESLALEECSKHTTNSYIARWIFSGN